MQAVDVKLESSEMTVDDRWFVTNGVEAVGPVSFELMSRGVAAGRIPEGALVRHASWKVWRRLEELEGLSDSKRDEAVAKLAEASASMEVRASNPHHEAPLPPSSEELSASANDPVPPSIRPVAVDPVGVLESATDLDQALLLALSTSVTASSSHLGLVHRVRPDLNAMVCSFAHGPNTEQLLGERLAENDPSLLSAQAGHTVVGEQRLGEAGRYIAGRLSRAISGQRGVAMVPVMLNSAMFAMIEVGRTSRPFKAREIARVEEVADAVAQRILDANWLN